MRKYVLVLIAAFAFANCANAHGHNPTQVRVLLNSVGLVPVQDEVLIQRSFGVQLGAIPVPVDPCAGHALVGFRSFHDRVFGVGSFQRNFNAGVNVNIFNRRFRR